KKIRTATTQKIPFLLLAGARDVEAGAVSFRFRDGSQHNGVPVDDAVAAITAWARSRTNASPTADGFDIAELVGAPQQGLGGCPPPSRGRRHTRRPRTGRVARSASPVAPAGWDGCGRRTA